MSEIYPLLRQAIEAEQPVATATLIVVPEGGPPLQAGAKLLVWPDGQTQGALGDAQLDAQARADALNLLEQGQTRTLEYDISSGAQVQVFIESFVPVPTLFVVGAVHIAIALVSLAKVLGFRTVVIDAREAFASDERFPHAHE